MAPDRFLWAEESEASKGEDPPVNTCPDCGLVCQGKQGARSPLSGQPGREEHKNCLHDPHLLCAGRE